MWKNIKNFFTNFGLRYLLENAFSQLKNCEDEVVAWVAAQWKPFVDGNWGKFVSIATSLGADEQTLQLLKEKGSELVPIIVAVLIHIVTSQAEKITWKLVDKLKI